MSEEQKVCEEFINVETSTELDAIHPRFMEPQNEEKLKEYQIENFYFCQTCNQFFAPTVRGLDSHFKCDFRQHSPCASCFYCKGSVFDYQANNQRRYYHNCKDSK